MYECTRCGDTFPEEEIKYRCPSCNSVLRIKRDLEEPSFSGIGIKKFEEALPIDSDLVTLKEGSTPFYSTDFLSHEYGIDDILLKYEGLNPTGSFKDRGSSVAVTKALEYGYNSVTLASTGNMAASVSAYASKARLKSKVFVPKETPVGKISQVIIYNGDIFRVKGGFQNAMDRAEDEAGSGSYLAETGLNPYYLEGEKTIAYELFNQMDSLPDVLIFPMGTGGFLTSAYWGFKELKKLGLIDEIPRLVGAQAKPCSPIVDALREEHKRPKPPKGAAETIASSIHVKTPFNGHTAIEAMEETDGFGVKVKDNKIIEAILEMGKEGIFSEPASALPLAALKKVLDPEEEDLHLDKDQRIMLMVTGNGLKESELMVEKGIIK